MSTTPRWMRVTVRMFLSLIIIVNLPGAEARLRRLLGSESGFKAVAWFVALSALGLAVAIWLGAIRHLDRNAAITGGQRTLWRSITYGAFIFGALIYYWRFMRQSAVA